MRHDPWFRRTLCAVAAVLLCGGRPAAAATNGYPRFSWDTVPVYLHLGKSGGSLTDKDLAFIARTSDFVCLEKGHGRQRFGSTEKGIAHDAKRLHVLNPEITVLFYWNGFLNYRLYDACAEFANHPDWVFRDKGGNPLYKVRTLEQYNLLHAGFRQWWASMAGRAIREYGCDGVFMDALLQPTSPKWMRQGWGPGNESAVNAAVIDMMKQARKQMGGNAVLLYNGVRSSDGSDKPRGEHFLPHASGMTIEHFGAFRSRSKESMAQDIHAVIRAGKAGKIAVVKGWPDPDFTWLNTAKMKRPHKELVAEAHDKITFPLACFLIAAQEYSYFAYSWGYRERDGSLAEYPAFRRPLGKPHGDAEKIGWRYTRSFEHLDVAVDLSRRTATLNWRE